MVVCTQASWVQTRTIVLCVDAMCEIDITQSVYATYMPCHLEEQPHYARTQCKNRIFEHKYGHDQMGTWASRYTREERMYDHYHHETHSLPSCLALLG